MATAAGFLRLGGRSGLAVHARAPGTIPAPLGGSVGEEGVLLTILSIEEVKTAAGTVTKLTADQKADIVARLAGYELPAEIARSLKEDLGIEIAWQSIAFYDPTRYEGRKCPPRWARLFRETRAKIVKANAHVGAAHRATRLRWLDQLVRAQMEKDNSAEARALLKQAADEMRRMAEERGDGSETAYSKLSSAELKAKIDADAAKLGLAVVPIESLAGAGGGGTAGERQPPGQPVSG